MAAFIKRNVHSFRERPLTLQGAALFSVLTFISLFVNDLTLYLNGFPRIRLSLFRVLTSGQMNLRIDDTTQTISFAEAIPWILLVLLGAALLMAVFLLYDKLCDRLPRAVIMGGTLLTLLLMIFARMLSVARAIPDSLRTTAGLANDALYISGGFWFQLLMLTTILLAFFTLLSLIGVRFRMRMLSYPYFGWISLFTILPLCLIVFAAFFIVDENGIRFSLDGFQTLLSGKMINVKFYGIQLRLQEYFSVFLRSVDYAIWTTIGCLALAYPLAYFLADKAKRSKSGNSGLLLLFFVLPMWINTLLRTYAWRSFFGQAGVLNNFLIGLGVIAEPILFLKGDFLGDFIAKLVLVNDFLPFMLLPIYSVLVKLDSNVKQAAHDLGANSSQTFRKVIFPLSLPGVISGIQMVFMPSLTFYMIPDILSEGSVATIGLTVQNFVLNESLAYQRAGNVLSLLLLVFVLITMGLLRNADRDDNRGGLAL